MVAVVLKGTHPVIGETITSAVLKISLWKYICRFLSKKFFFSDSCHVIWSTTLSESLFVRNSPNSLRVQVGSAAEGTVDAQRDPGVPADLRPLPATIHRMPFVHIRMKFSK